MLTPETISVFSVVGAVCVTCVHIFVAADEQDVSALDRKKRLAASIRTVGAVLWPAFMLNVVPPEDRCNPRLVMPLLWNVLAWSIDIHLLRNSRSRDDGTLAALRFDPGPLTGLAFGMSGLLGSRPDSTYTHLFMYAILGCFILVLPSHNLEPGCTEEQIFDSVQKSALMYCTGLLITAIVLTRYPTKSERA